MIEPTPWVPFLFMGAGVYLMLALALLRRHYGPGTRTVGLSMLAVAVWTVGAIAEWQSGSPEATLLSAKFKYTGIVLVSPLILLFFLQYLERIALRRWQIGALFVIPAATIVVTWTNDLHQWMWINSSLDRPGIWDMRAHWGPWFWNVHLPYSYLTMAAGIFILAIEWWRGTKLHRSQVALLFIATLMPTAVNVLFILGYFPGNFGPTPIALAASSVLYAWGFVRLEIFRRSPIAYHAVLENMQDGVIVVDAYDRVVDLNPSASRLCGWRERNDFVGHRLDEILPLPSSSETNERIANIVSFCFEDERGRRLEMTASPIRVASGSLRGRVILLRDVSERHAAEAALHQSEALVRSLVDVSPNGILRLQPRIDETGVIRDFTCLFANAAAAAWVGRPQTDLIGRPFRNFAKPHTPILFRAFRDVLMTGERCDLERAVRHRGREVWLRFLAVPADSDLVVTCVDVTETKLREQRMVAAASEDPLTGLLNRRGFEADAGSLLASASNRMERGALLYIDLDGFKRINDSLGHEVGDLLLCELAGRFQRCTRGPDLLSRIGGDEFVMLLIDLDRGDALDVAERVARTAREPIRIESTDVVCPVSVGVAFYPEAGSDLKSLLQAADRTMYQAKASGGGVASTKGSGEPDESSTPSKTASETVRDESARG